MDDNVELRPSGEWLKKIKKYLEAQLLLVLLYSFFIGVWSLLCDILSKETYMSEVSNLQN